MNVPLWVAIFTVTLAAIATWAGVRTRRIRGSSTRVELPAMSPGHASPGHTRAAPSRPDVRAPSTRPGGSSASGRPGLMSVYSAKGGTGVSTLAVNLAVGIRRERGLRVALADLDPQSGDAAFLLGLGGGASSAAGCCALPGALLEHESGVTVLAQLDRAGDAPQPGAAALDGLLEHYDAVVADTPHALSGETVEIFERSARVLLLVESTVPAIRAARRAIDALDRRGHASLLPRMLLVVNRHDGSAAVSLEQIERTLGLPVFATIADDRPSIRRAADLGAPLPRLGGAAARDIALLARRLVPED